MVLSTSQKEKEDEPEPKEEVFDLSLFLRNPKPQVLDQDKVYKDLNKRFYEKGTEHEFASYKQAIEKIKEKSSNPDPFFHMGMLYFSPEVVKLHETKKVIQYFSQEYTGSIRRVISINIHVEMTIFKNTKHNTLYKIYSLGNQTSPLTIGQLKCVFYNEIYYQQKARKKASSDHTFIVPQLINYISFVDERDLYLIMEMDFVDMIMVSDVLTPNNAEKYFKSIVDAVDKLNSAGVYQNDLSPDNVKVSRENKEKIVIIDFGQASNEKIISNAVSEDEFPYSSNTDPKHLFLNSNATTTMDYKSFVDWATDKGKYPLAMSQKQESHSSPNKSHKSSRHESPISPNKSHKNSRHESPISPNKSHKSSRHESPISPNKSHKSSRRESPISPNSLNSSRKRKSYATNSPNKISSKSSRKRSLTGGKTPSKRKKGQFNCGSRRLHKRK